MKKIAIYVLLILGIGFGSVSCGEKFLEVEYYSIVNPDGVYEDPNNVYLGLVGVYSTVYGASDYFIKPHPALANLPALDLQADGWDAEMSTHSWGVESKSNFFESAWTNSYKMVSKANIYLADLANVTSVDEKTKLIYEAEARAIRAYAYFYLTINFSRVPMLMTGETYATSPEKARPESDAAAWQLIKEDFEFAAQHLDWKPADGQVGRFTKTAALAYAAKVNMYLGDFATAKSQLKDVIDNSGKQLNPVHGMIHWVDYMDSYETVWEVSYPKFDKMGWDIWSFAKNNDCRYFGQQTKSHEYGGWGDSPISYEYVRSFEPGDKRLLYNVVGWHGDHGGTNPYTGDVIGKQEAYQSYFMDGYEGMPNNHSLKWWKVNDVYSAHSVQLYRFTEVLLNYAECCFMTSDDANGWAAIDKVRDRAFGNLEVGHNPNNGKSYLEFPVELLNTEKVAVTPAKDYYANYETALGKKYSIETWKVALLQERRKEFVQEFSFWYDLCRMDLVEEWLEVEYPKNGGATFYNTKTKEFLVPTGKSFNEPWDKASAADRENLIPITARTFDWNPGRAVYPIPTSELTANPLCTQNEAYL